ncbi:hypothetical protein EVAR_53434_1 [Eumeta japonica]|uniref:Uncharacterized protein n=1 Tax=Eumeta variegata TaxID=151549 RepID=A0A4C1Y491_EUMVA|nr:hypothetical protein EVAR_53434_1 [Eumeta japonica]
MLLSEQSLKKNDWWTLLKLQSGMIRSQERPCKETQPRRNGAGRKSSRTSEAAGWPLLLSTRDRRKVTILFVNYY